MQYPEVLTVSLSKLAASGVVATFEDFVLECHSQPLSGSAFDSGAKDTNITPLHAGTLLTGSLRNEWRERGPRLQSSAVCGQNHAMAQGGGAATSRSSYC